MKRHLAPFVMSVWLATPLMAQEPYYPAYGYSPHSGYGYPAQTPVGPDYSGAFATPSGQPTQAGPALRPGQQSPTYENAPSARQDYQPMFTNPEQARHYRFRPLQEAEPATVGEPRQGHAGESSGSARAVVATPLTPAYQKTGPLAPLTYPQNRVDAQSLAPLSHPEARMQVPASTVERRDSTIQQGPELKFRPLDKPGYSSDLGE